MMKLEKPDIKSPSSNENEVEGEHNKKVSNEKKLKIIIVLLSISIICLLIIIYLLLLSPSPVINDKSKKETTIIQQESKKESYVNVVELSNVQEEVVKEITDNNIVEDKSKKTNKKNNLEEKFDHYISEALFALEKKQYNLAYQKIKAAENINKKNNITQEIKERINKEIKNSKIENLIYKATQEEKKSQWKKALSYYEEALKIDAGINSIIVKKQRAIANIKIDKILDEIINKPERLQNKKILIEARKSLEMIKEEIKENKYLLSKVKAAEKVIIAADTAVIVTIESDNKTEITIYKVAFFGKLIQKKIELRPGKYTVVGTREGYRDIRKNLTIKAGHNPTPVRIICREAI